MEMEENSLNVQTTNTLNANVISDDLGEANQCLTFMLAGEEYGVDILRVQEIKGWDAVTAIPNTPEYIRGVMNLRGTIVPIIDMRLRFELEHLKYGPTTVVIVLRVDGVNKSRVMGIVVDGVSDVYNLKLSDIKPAPNFGSAVDTEFVKGVTTVGEKLVVLLDIDYMLNSSELEELEQPATS
jgi:purine-binding chemotaxis protein CheW